MEKIKRAGDELRLALKLIIWRNIILVQDLPQTDREEGKMYMQKEGSRLKYIVDNLSGVFEGSLDINIPTLTQDFLVPHKAAIFTEISERGHAPVSLADKTALDRKSEEMYKVIDDGLKYYHKKRKDNAEPFGSVLIQNKPFSPESKEWSDMLKQRIERLNNDIKLAKEVWTRHETGDIDYFIDMQPIEGLTLLTVLNLLGIFNAEKISSKAGKKGKEAAEKKKGKIKLWYEEGVELDSWKNQTEAIKKFKEWKENVGIVEQHKQSLIAIVDKSKKTVDASNKTSVVVPEEQAHITKAKNAIEKMEEMNQKPSSNWTKYLIKAALKGYKRIKLNSVR